jgi:hypothetical protein
MPNKTFDRRAMSSTASYSFTRLTNTGTWLTVTIVAGMMADEG